MQLLTDLKPGFKWSKTASRLAAFAVVSGLAVASSIAGSRVASAEKIGTVRQGLVGGTEVSEKTQEAYGLLEFKMGGGSCSASLLRNDWAISAAHCVEAKDSKGRTMKDPNRPGQNVLRPMDRFRLKAVWGGGQSSKVTQVHTFRPYDISLLKLDKPILVNGKTTGYAREVMDDQFPYFGSPGGAVITVYGMGINTLAFGKGDSAMPTTSDDKFRSGKFRVTREEANLYWYPSTDKQMVMGGDSGGPSFVQVGSTYTRMVLVGVHAMTLATYVEGKPTDGWDWVTSTTEAADAPIKPVWKQIEGIMGKLPEIAPPAEPFTGRHSAVFENTVPFGKSTPSSFNTLYGVKADGTLVWHRHMMTGLKPIVHSWNPTKDVGTGWLAGYKEILPAGLNGMYVERDNGDLLLYRHNGSLDGSYNWSEPRQIGTGWTMFTQIIPMDKGVVYGITPDGQLRWQRYMDYKSGDKGVRGWTEPRIVGWGWNGFKHIFAGTEGVFYVVGQDNKLMWHKHKSYLNPVPIPKNSDSDAVKLKWQNSWEEKKEVGTGWGGFTKLFSPGEGHIYGVATNGDLMWYRHYGYATGKPTWEIQGGKVIAKGWDSYVRAFARTTTSDLGSGDASVDIIVK